MKNGSKLHSALVLKILFVISGTVMTALVSTTGSVPLLAAGVVCSFVVLCVLTFRLNLIRELVKNADSGQMLIAAALSFVFAYYNSVLFYGIIEKIIKRLSPLLNIPLHHLEIIGSLSVGVAGLVALLAIFLFFCAFIGRFYAFARDWLCETDRIEKIYMTICGIVLAVSVLIIFSSTNVFYGAQSGGKPVLYDVVYTTDSGRILDVNAYLNVSADENDIRQPLFGVFAAPFASAAMLISAVLFFIPNIYPIVMNIIQGILLFAAFVTLARLLELRGLAKAAFLTALTLTYPTLLYSLNMEQYIFSVFWLIMLIYAYLMKKESGDYLYIAATGSLLTSGIFFPPLTRARSLRARLCDTLGTGLKFAAILIVFGRFSAVATPIKSLTRQMRFVGKNIAFSDRLMQFFGFVSSCFTAPAAGADSSAYANMSYQLAPVSSVSVAGILLLIAAALGFALNYKNKFARICAVWVAFSFLLLCAVGWGTKENGLILYTLYFSWAYVSLIFMLIKKLTDSLAPLKYAVYTAAILTLAAVNLPGIYELICFGIQYYPVR